MPVRCSSSDARANDPERNDLPLPQTINVLRSHPPTNPAPPPGAGLAVDGQSLASFRSGFTQTDLMEQGKVSPSAPRKVQNRPRQAGQVSCGPTDQFAVAGADADAGHGNLSQSAGLIAAGKLLESLNRKSVPARQSNSEFFSVHSQNSSGNSNAPSTYPNSDEWVSPNQHMIGYPTTLSAPNVVLPHGTNVGSPHPGNPGPSPKLGHVESELRNLRNQHFLTNFRRSFQKKMFFRISGLRKSHKT